MDRLFGPQTVRASRVVPGTPRQLADKLDAFLVGGQLLQSVRYKSGKPLEHKLVMQVIRESEARLANNGRLVIRPSGTEPVIRVMAESDDKDLVEAVVAEITNTIKQVA